jgi:ferredoxin
MILAPETFEVDDFGFAHVPEHKRDVAADRIEVVKAAARNCPEMAIILSGG